MKKEEKPKKIRLCRNCGKQLKFNWFFCNSECMEAYVEKRTRYLLNYTAEKPKKVILSECLDCDQKCKIVVRNDIDYQYKLICRKNKDFHLYESQYNGGVNVRKN